MDSGSDALVVFEDEKIRRIWHADEWYFSVVDVAGVLTGSLDPNNYWKVLKNRLKKEGSQLVTDCNQLKMRSSDGKRFYLPPICGGNFFGREAGGDRGSEN